MILIVILKTKIIKIKIKEKIIEGQILMVKIINLFLTILKKILPN